MGLATLLNTKIFDTYFRTFNGNINVSATELRDLKLPSLEIINNIGSIIYKSLKNINKIDIDQIVNEQITLHSDDRRKNRK